MKNVLSALQTFMHLALPYFRSQDRWRACSLLAGVIGSELFVVYVAVKMNEWNRSFFNAIEVRDGSGVRNALLVFVVITVGAILSGMGQYWFGQTLIIRWREWMTQRYVALWMAEGRHYRIRFVDQTVDNIHLRIGNDVLLFIQRTHELGTGFLQSIVSLLSFAWILWGISLVAPLPLFGTDLAFPGYLVLLAIGYAALGTVVAHFIGWPLIPLQFRQQRYESDFRFALARVTDHADAVAVMGGEAVERSELRRRFTSLVRNWVALVNRQNGLNGFIFGYYHVSTVFPALIVTPAYLASAITLGVLMQAALAFQKVESAFAFCITSYAKIAEWRAVMNRVAQFEAAMGEVDRPGLAGAAIDIAPAAGDELSIRDLVVRLPDGEPIASVPSLKLAAGDRLLVSGPSGAGKSSLFRGLAGTWPLGEGQVRFPRGTRVLALPQRPYFPLGSLRQALSYPLLAEEIDDVTLHDAMVAAGLGHLTERLDEEAEWNAVLSGGEQQRAGFVRALIYRPTILLLDEAVSTLEESEARQLYALLSERLPGTIVISTGRAVAGAEPHQRVFEMTGSPVAGRTVRPSALAERIGMNQPGRATMLNWWEKWGLHPDVCPCDVHFNEWVEAEGISNKLIYHFGTGTHHVIGRRQAELGAGNVVFGITASKGEYDDYVALVIDNAAVAKSYLAYFGDVYLTNPRLLPDFDVVNLFHLCEFFSANTKSPEYGGLDDRELLDVFTAKTRPGGHILFYKGSNGFNNAQPIIAAWEKEQPVERLDDFKSLLVYRKTM